MLAGLPGSRHSTLFWLLPLGVVALVVYRAPIPTRGGVAIAYAEAAAAGVAVGLTGGSKSAMLPYLLAPGLALGLQSGPWAVVRGGLLTELCLLATALQRGGHDGLRDVAVAASQWVLLSIAIGLVAAWARRLTASAQPAVDGYAQVRGLLEQLRTAAQGLPGGLDAPSAAEALLDDAARTARATRAAVLVQTAPDGALIPMAIRGARRVPWRTPLTEPGPLQRAWLGQLPVVDRRPPDRHGLRHGNALAVFPLVGSAAPYGLMILDSADPDAFTDSEIAQIAAGAREAVQRLETALLFEQVRSLMTVEERDRLAREMHDGVAQDLAFIGYRLDGLRMQAAKVDEELARSAAELRADLTELIANLRLSITDLRTSISASRGLGAALSSYVRAIGSGHKLAVHLSLQESPFRLPAEQEVALFRVTQAVAQDVRRSGRASNMWVTLSVEPPSARLLVEHDGPPGGLDETPLAAVSAVLERLGGRVFTRPRRGGGVTVEAAFEGGPDASDSPPGGRSRAHPTGPAPSLRADR